ncbi:MAG: hypothetical protein AB8B85_12870 [Paracoccaceae bacterium]
MTQEETKEPAILSDDALEQVEAGSSGGMVRSSDYTAPHEADEPTVLGFKTPFKRIGKLHRGPGL